MNHTTFQQWVQDYSPRFKKLFNFDLPYDFSGLDNEKLEGILNIPWEQSFSDFVKDNYGQDALDLIEEIIVSHPPHPK